MGLRDAAYRRMREAAWAYSPVWWSVGGPLGRPYGPEDVQRAAHRLKAWRRALDWVQGRGRFPRRGGEEEVDVPPGRRRRRPPRQYSPWDPLHDVRWDLAPDESPPEEWTEWVEEDVGPWEEQGILEGGVSAGPSVQPGMAPEAVEVGEIGETRLVEIQVAPAATVALVSAAVAGPVVVERVGIWASATGALVDVGIRAVPAGVGVAGTTPPAELPGVPLWQSASATGAVGVLALEAFSGFAEMWPRLVLPWQAVAFAVSVRNRDAANGWRIVAGMDTRRVTLR